MGVPSAGALTTFLTTSRGPRLAVLKRGASTPVNHETTLTPETRQSGSGTGQRD
jgi:hypothetical protein